RRQKNSILFSDLSAFAKGSGAINRDKIEPICSPKMYVERTPKWRSPASRGIKTIIENKPASNPFLHVFLRKLFAPYALGNLALRYQVIGCFTWRAIPRFRCRAQRL